MLLPCVDEGDSEAMRVGDTCREKDDGRMCGRSNMMVRKGSYHHVDGKEGNKNSIFILYRFILLPPYWNLNSSTLYALNRCCSRFTSYAIFALFVF